MIRQRGGEPQMKKFLIELPEDLVLNGKRYALDHGLTLKAVVKEALEMFLKGKKGGKK
jgi:hypothetical protein